MLGRRDVMDAGMRTVLSRAILRDIVCFAAYRRSEAVMAYSSFGSELQTDEFMRHTLDRGKTLLLPRANRRKRVLDIYSGLR
jgi:5-formyltetrahydrofolate cyclo-ligase